MDRPGIALDGIKPGGATGGFAAIGEQQAQALQPATIDEAFVQNAIKQGAFQFFLFFASIFALITTLFLRRTYGERSFGLRAFVTLVIVATIGFSSARDPENAYALSWFGPLFVLLWIGMFIFHRVEMFIRKVKKLGYIYSRTDGDPWLPWALIPSGRAWAHTSGYSIVSGWLDPALAFAACWFATKFIGDQFAVMLLISGFSILVTYQMKSYLEREKYLDTMDAQVEAQQRLLDTQMIDGAKPRPVDQRQGYLVAQAPAIPGFLKDLPVFAEPDSQPVDQIPELRQAPDPPTAPTERGESRRTVAAPVAEPLAATPPVTVAAPPAAAPAEMVAALDPDLQALVTPAPPPQAAEQATEPSPQAAEKQAAQPPPLPPAEAAPVATAEPEPVTTVEPQAEDEDGAAAPELTARLDARLLKTIADAGSPEAAAAIPLTRRKA